MYKEFFKETYGYETLETEFGFATFGVKSFCGENVIYINYLYIKPEFRNSKNCLSIFEKICEMAQKANIKTILGSVGVGIQNAERNLRLYFLFDFKIHSTLPNLIYLTKVLK